MADPAAEAGIQAGQIAAQQGRQQVAGAATEGAPAASYTVISDGTTITVFDKNGVPSYSGSDAGAAITALLPAAGSAGASILFRNDGQVFPWGSVPALPKGITGKLLIDFGGATVRLSASGPRLFDFNKTADGDTFQNIEIANGTIDVNNVGGQHHVILGTYVGGAITTRINFANITVRSIRTTNVPVDSTAANHRLNLYLVVVDADSQSTNYSIRDVLVEKVRCEGGNQGLVVGGDHSNNGNALNVTVDRVTFRDCYHSLLAVQTSFFSSAHFFIGARAKGGTCLIENCYGEFSGDVGVEIDAMSDATVLSSTMVDCYSVGFFHTNYNTPSQAAAQHVRFRDCHSIRVSSNTMKGFQCRSSSITGATSIPLGTVTVENCSATCNDGTEGTLGWAIYRQDDASPPGSFVTKLNIRNFTLDHTIGGTASPTIRAISITPSAGTNIVHIDGIGGRIGGNHASGTVTYNVVYLAGQQLHNLIVSRVRPALTTTSINASAFRLVMIGESSTTLVGRNTIRESGWSQIAGGGTSPLTFAVIGTGTLTLSGKVVFEQNDCSKQTAGTDFSVDSTQAGKVYLRGNTYKNAVVPVPVNFTGLVSATGKVLGVNWDATVVFLQGTGAGITAIDYSTDSGVTYTNFLTQASAALPGGFDQELGPLPPDALIKVTFATTQPTITLVPTNP